MVIGPEERNIIRELQRDLEIIPRPFATLAQRLGLTEAEFLSRCQGLLETGIMRRYGAAINHHRAGFTQNAMVCWRVPPERVDEVGKALASSPWVTHCYQRRLSEQWPYNLFIVIHGRSRGECLGKASIISQAVGVDDYVALFSVHEYKKSRLRYFEEGVAG